MSSEINGDIFDLEEETQNLLLSIARGDPLPKKDRKNQVPSSKLLKYTRIYEHPLPMSEHWPIFQATLRRVLSCHLDEQIISAVVLNNSWVLEEVYMRGANPELSDINGFRPIHIACQNNAFECLMVLLNIGVDINAETISGVTPLYLAHAAGATQCMHLLKKHSAKYTAESRRVLAGASVLDPVTGADAKKRSNDF